MKKYLILCFCLVFFCAGNAYSQGLQNELKVYRPDFSGTWKLNIARSVLKKNLPAGFAAITWIVDIQQTLPAISVTLRGSKGADEAVFAKVVYYTDGRGDEYRPDVAERIASTSEWQDNKLVTTCFSFWQGRKEVTDIMEVELAADGNTLIGTSKETKIGVGPKGERIRYIDETKTQSAVFDRIK